MAKKARDFFFNLKYIAYCWSEPNRDKPDLDRLVNFAKFQLCVQTKTLMKDPIWDEYTKEEILTEWQAYQFNLDPEKRNVKEFEKQLFMGTEVGEFDEWADKLIAADNKEKEENLKESEDSYSFSPNDVLG